jgi:hypothetical protein
MVGSAVTYLDARDAMIEAGYKPVDEHPEHSMILHLYADEEGRYAVLGSNQLMCVALFTPSPEDDDQKCTPKAPEHYGEILREILP